MRTVEEIDTEISGLDEERRTLMEERDRAVKARERRMLVMWDDEGATFNAIAREVGLRNSTVKMFLFNRGRTVAGRNAQRAQLASLGPRRVAA